MNFYHLIQGDCLQVLSTIEDETIDLVLTDPPYNIDLNPQRKLHKGESIIGDNLSEEMFKAFFKKTIYHYWRILKEGTACFIFGDWKTYPVLYDLLSTPFEFKNCIVWDKLHFGIGYDFRPQYELIYYLIKGKHKLKKQDLGNVIQCKKVYEQEHIAQKPEKLIKQLILYASNKNDIVIDPFIGSGTTMEACQHSVRSCIGIEIDPTWCRFVKKRCFGRQFLDRRVFYDFKIQSSLRTTNLNS